MTDLWPGEELLGQWIAATAIGSLTAARVGGRLVLTDRRLVFKPMTVEGGTLAKSIFGLGNALARLDDHYLPLLDITAVEAGEGPSRMVVRLQTGADRTYLVAHRRMTTVFSAKNAPARDNAVKRIWAAVQAVGR
ncbi:hypothetical protein ACIRBX_36655 [Kitasatospora sp. NPDC096147]|uniref:hypothetical protein n=1 Tax=Kitasatospora sp. NPDC096147 TaxID=3364093 RepID=UPI00382A7458